MNNAAIKAAEPGSVVRDTVVPGLHLRVLASGRKSFYLYFRTKAGRERRPKIGDFPLFTIANARDAAKALLLEVAKGHDPVAERQAAKDAPTVEKLMDRYKTEHATRKKSTREDKRIIDVYVVPRLGAMKAADVTHDDVSALHTSLKATPYMANRVLSLLSKAFSLAETWRIRPRNSNPCHGVRRFQEQARRRYMDGREAPAIAAALNKRRQSHPQQVAFVFLLILTGARCSEIENAKAEYLAGSKLELPDSKTGRRTIYLPATVMDILTDLSPFPGDTLVGIKAPRKFWNMIRKEAGCPDLRMHDLRHSFASAALSAGLTLGQIGELLGHASTQTTQRYAHLVEEMGTTAVEQTAQVIRDRMFSQ